MMVYLALLHAGIAGGHRVGRGSGGRAIRGTGIQVLVCGKRVDAGRGGRRRSSSGCAAAGGSGAAAGRGCAMSTTRRRTRGTRCSARSRARGNRRGILSDWGEPIKVDDWRRPIFAREATIARNVPSTQPYQTAHGAGLVCVVPRTAGKDYMDGAREVQGKLAKAIVFPGRSAAGGDYRVRPCRPARGRPRARRSARFLPGHLWTQQKGVVLLANFSGEPAENNGRAVPLAAAGEQSAVAANGRGEVHVEGSTRIRVDHADERGDGRAGGGVRLSSVPGQIRFQHSQDFRQAHVAPRRPVHGNQQQRQGKRLARLHDQRNLNARQTEVVPGIGRHQPGGLRHRAGEKQQGRILVGRRLAIFAPGPVVPGVVAAEPLSSSSGQVWRQTCRNSEAERTAVTAMSSGPALANFTLTSTTAAHHVLFRIRAGPGRNS